MVPIFTESRFYGFLSINTGKLNGQLFGADSYVILSVVSKIAQAMERNQDLVKLRKSQKMLQRLASRIIYMQEEERKKISAEIHDTIIQRLTGIWFKLLYLEETMPIRKQTDLDSFVSLKSYVNDSIKEGRRIVYGLRPLMLDELGAKKTIEEYVKNFRLENSMEVDLGFQGGFFQAVPGKADQRVPHPPGGDGEYQEAFEFEERPDPSRLHGRRNCLSSWRISVPGNRRE